MSKRKHNRLTHLGALENSTCQILGIGDTAHIVDGLMSPCEDVTIVSLDREEDIDVVILHFQDLGPECVFT